MNTNRNMGKIGIEWKGKEEEGEYLIAIFCKQLNGILNSKIQYIYSSGLDFATE